jgi:ABC-type uncharacterized transport system ATPase subunit
LLYAVDAAIIKTIMKETVIKVDKLTKKFGDFIATNQITFEVAQGEIFGFLGANGAGKTTAMRMLCGLLIPTSGSATVAGFDVYKETEHIKQNIGYMSQKFSLYEDLTVKENIRFYAGIYGMSRSAIKEKMVALKDAGIAKLAFSLDGSTAQLHDGMRRIEGTFGRTMHATQEAKGLGISIQINSLVHADNVDDLKNIVYMNPGLFF